MCICACKHITRITKFVMTGDFFVCVKKRITEVLVIRGPLNGVCGSSTTSPSL